MQGSKLKKSHDFLAQSGMFCSCHWKIMIWLILIPLQDSYHLKFEIFCNVW
jgi:hypothetical protein